jgi:hypothetical protein
MARHRRALPQGAPGTNWYRTQVTLNVPRGQDATIGIAFGDTAKPRSSAQYRTLILSTDGTWGN